MNSALKFSYVFLAFLISNWVLFLFGFYALFSYAVAGSMWNFSWIGLCLLGIVAGIRELKNNLFIGIVIFVLTIFTGLFYRFSLFIDSM